MRRILGVIACATCAVPAAAQQQRLQFTAGGGAFQEIVQSHVDSNNSRFTGLLLGAEGSLVSDRFIIRLRYAEGKVNPRDAAIASGGGGALANVLHGTAAAAAIDSSPRDVVEGEALVGFRALPWLTLWAGPTARAYTVGDANQRWLMWSGRASARGTLLPGRMLTFLELWGALSGNVGNPPISASGRGADGGLEVRLGEAAAFWGRLGYRIQSTHAEGLRETVESLTLSLVYGLPQ